MLIEVKGVNKTYNNGQPLHVLKGIDLSVSEGEFVSIMGLPVRESPRFSIFSASSTTTTAENTA